MIEPRPALDGVLFLFGIGPDDVSMNVSGLINNHWGPDDD